MVFETDRLYARTYNLDDVETAFDIYRKPEVNRYLGRNPKSLETLQEAQEMLERWVANQAKRPAGQGTWALVRKKDERIIGTIMCKALPTAELEPSGEIEIGWHLDPEAWGYGYATEAGLAVAEYGFRMDPNLPRVLAVVYPENAASQKVARNVGMTHLGLSSDFYGMELELFELKRPVSNVPE
ncbi:MAG: GNAT family N-acetyltransferase [Armatimonadota bacterium]